MAGVLFKRAPRVFENPLPVEPFVIQAPPTVSEDGGQGWAMYVLPMLGALGAVGFVLFYHNLLMILMAVGMGVVSLGSGILMWWQQKGTRLRRMRNERTRYLQYLRQMEEQLALLVGQHHGFLHRMYPPVQEMAAWADGSELLWNRRQIHPDFLTARLGLGTERLCRPVYLDVSNHPLTTYVPELETAARELVEQFQQITEVPVTFDMRAAGVIALSHNHDEKARGVIRGFLIQSALFCGPDELEYVLVVDPARREAWNWGKWLPHFRREGHLFFIESADEWHQLMAPELSRRRSERAERTEGTEEGALGSHIVVVVDGLDTGSDAYRAMGLDRVLSECQELGITVWYLAGKNSASPTDTRWRFILDHDDLRIQELKPGGRSQDGIRAEPLDLVTTDQIARKLAPWMLTRPDERFDASRLIRLWDLLEPRIGTLPTERPRWAPESELLKVPIGKDATGRNLVLDLKEAAEGGMGPHGMVVGATGSGKSELLRSIVTGLAVSHDPEQVALMLVDFKGGAAFGPVKGIAHVAGLITNIERDLTLVDRMQAALYGELERRQRILREAGHLDNLKQYHRLRQAQPHRDPLPYLVCVVDEFGELLSQRPDFLDLFVTIGRVGRSVGIHLLLATQRLDEGRIRGLEGYLRYRIGLRMFSAQESASVLGSPDAYHLAAVPGIGYFKVDTEIYLKFKVATVSSFHNPSHRAAPVEPVRLLTDSAPRSQDAALVSSQTDAEALLAPLKANHRTTRQIWLPPLSSHMTWDGLWPVFKELPKTRLEVPIGYLDRPVDQRQDPLIVDFSGSGAHLAVVGAPQSGKSWFLRTLLAAVIAERGPQFVQVYALDFGGGGLGIFRECPHVGGIYGKKDDEPIRYLWPHLFQIIERREEIFRRHGIDDMDQYRRRRETGLAVDDPFGDIFVVIDNLGEFLGQWPDEDAYLIQLAATGPQFGIHLIVSANRWGDIRSRLRDAIGNRFELRLNDPHDSDISRQAQSGLLPGTPGRGLSTSGLQFQVAIPVWKDLDGAHYSPDKPEDVRRFLERWIASQQVLWSGVQAPRVKILPSKVVWEPDALDSSADSGMMIGISEVTLAPVRWNPFLSDPHLMVLGDSGAGKTNLLRHIATRFLARPVPVELAIVDYRRQLQDLCRRFGVRDYAYAAPMARDLVTRIVNVLEARMAPGASETGIWQGPHYVLIVDDYDWVASPTGNPLLPLADWLMIGRDVGFHMILARNVGGISRAAFEPVIQRLRELRTTSLIFNGDPQEGPIIGNVKAEPLPTGRARFVQPGQRPRLIQTVYASDDQTAALDLNDSKS